MELEVYPVRWSTDFTEFYPDEKELGEPAGYAVIPYRHDRDTLGTCFGDVDRDTVETLIELKDAATALRKHYESKGWHVEECETFGYSQGDWCKYIVAVGGDVWGETFDRAKYAERLADDYGLWLQGDVFITEHPVEKYSSTFLAVGYDRDDIRIKAREALDVPEDTPVAVFEPVQITSWQEV